MARAPLVLLLATALWLAASTGRACLLATVIFEHRHSHFAPNASVRLPCDYELGGDIRPKRGEPLPRISWFRNGQQLPADLSPIPNRLRLPPCNANLTAWYACHVHTSHGAFKVRDFPAACEWMAQPRLLLHHGASVLEAEGSIVVLECRVDRLWSPVIEPTFSWRFNGTRLALRPDTVYTVFPCTDLRERKRALGSFEKELRLPSVARCLLIRSFRPAEHAGTYTCEVIRGRRSPNVSLSLHLGAKVDRPFPPATATPEVVDVRNNRKDLRLPCSAAGVLFENQTEWTDSAGHRLATAHLLDVSRLSRLPKEIVFECRLRRNSGDSVARVVKAVRVRFFPTYWNIRPSQNDQYGLTHRVNDSLHLECSPGQNLPAFEVTWFLNGRRLVSDGHLVTVRGANLRIARLDRTRHSGFFQCRVRSALPVLPPDEHWKNFLVLVTQPTLPKWLHVTVGERNTRSVTLSVSLDTSRLPLCGKLSCELKENGIKFPSYEMLQVRKSEPSALVMQVEFNKLHPFRYYTGVCRYFDNNGVNVTMQSSSFSFRTLEDRPSHQPDFEITEERSGGLVVTWEPMELTSANGKITRHRVRWRLIIDEAFHTKEVPADQFSLELTGLMGNAFYQVTVFSGTSVGYPLFNFAGRTPLLLTGHTVPLVGRALVPRCTIIERVRRALRHVDNVQRNLTIEWTVKPIVRKYLTRAVSRWNFTLLFSNSPHVQSFLVASNVTSKTVRWPRRGDQRIGQRRALVWLEALDSADRVLDDAVIAVKDNLVDLDDGARPISPPANVSVHCLPSDYGLLVRWMDPPNDSFCVNPQTEHSCFVRIRLIPLPFKVHRRRRYIRLSPYTNASAVERGVFHVTGLQPDTLYAVAVAFERQPPLVSDFATPKGAAACRVLSLPLPVPNVTLVHRLDAQRVWVRVILPSPVQNVQAVSSSAARPLPSAPVAPPSRIKLVALRFCDAAHRPFPHRSPFFISPAEATHGHVVKIGFPFANDSSAQCGRRGNARRREAVTYVQAASCYERDHCTVWSSFVRVKPEPRNESAQRDGSHGDAETLSEGRLWLFSALGMGFCALVALIATVVLTLRLHRARRLLRLRARDGLEFAVNGKTSALGEEAPETQPFMSPTHHLPRTNV